MFANSLSFGSGVDRAIATNGNLEEALVPAIVLGGAQNALSVARSLAREGIEVIVVNYPREAVRFSRDARYVKLKDGNSTASWRQFLLSPESDAFAGAVLLPCSDEAIRLMLGNHAALSRKFLLEETDPVTRGDLLDKFTTYRRAEQAGVPTVKYSVVRTRAELEAAASGARYPMIMKPLYSFDWRQLKFKAALIQDRDDLLRRFQAAEQVGSRVVLMDYIPGGDDRLCSYFTYLDESGSPLVHFTKRVKRRFPLESGDGTYHVTDWIPEAAELGLRFFRSMKFRGLGNVEFKWDERDNMLKIIEANARFTNSDCLITRSGINLALITYNRITGRPQAPALDYKKSMVLCRPIEDAFAAFGLWKAGKLRFFTWLAELRRVDMLPFFNWRDPLPAGAALAYRIWRLAFQALRR